MNTQFNSNVIWLQLEYKISTLVIFLFFIMNELWDLAQENLVDIQGSYGILDQYLWMSGIP